MRWKAQCSLRGMMALVAASAIALWVWYVPTTYDIHYDNTGVATPHRKRTEIGNPITIFSIDSQNVFSAILRDAPVIDLLYNDDFNDTIRIRVTIWQKLVLSLHGEKAWRDTSRRRGGIHKIL